MTRKIIKKEAPKKSAKKVFKPHIYVKFGHTVPVVLTERMKDAKVESRRARHYADVATEIAATDTGFGAATTNYGDALPHKTTSLCPECVRPLDALVYADGGIVWISKTCPEHGEFKEKYWESEEMYERERKRCSKGTRILNPNVPNTGANCPFDCGLCDRHKSHTALANIVVTNRCDLNCWYCFFYAKENDPVYEPTLEQIRAMARNLRAERPVPCNAVQLSGGEPTLRDDIVEILRICKEEGIGHVQLNTHGINLALKPDLARQVRAVGSNTVYMSFDGMTAKTNPKNHWEVPYAMENCRKVGMGIILVPTVIGSVNDHELGDILNFAFNNNDIIRGVNFQPVSLVGRMPQKQREKQRITIPKAIANIEEQTNGVIGKEDFYAVPTVEAVTEFVEGWTNKSKYRLSTHFACGMATYAIKGDDGKVVPLPRFVDVEGLMEYITEKSGDLKSGANKYWVGLKLMAKMGKFVDKSKQPKGFKMTSMLLPALLTHNYRSLAKLHHNSMFIGLMHFQDLYNYDVERVERCCIHYAMPDGRIIPFCAFNVLPEVYRDKVQAQYGISAKEWEAKTGKKLAEGKYKRDIKTLEEGETYQRTYNNLKDYFA